MCFNKVEGPKTLKRHTLVKNNMTQITGDFIKKIREIFKESEKLYETEEKIKLQTQNSRLLPILCKPPKWYRIEISNWRLKICQGTKTARRYG